MPFKVFHLDLNSLIPSFLPLLEAVLEDFFTEYFYKGLIKNRVLLSAIQLNRGS